MDENKENKPAAAPSKFLGREQILSKTALKSEAVSVPEWGGNVRVRELTGAERDYYEGKIVTVKSDGSDPDVSMENARAILVALAVVDDAGRRVFSEEDAIEIGKLGAVAIGRVFDVAAKLSRLTSQDLEELAGN